jgi:hypothetical protein
VLLPDSRALEPRYARGSLRAGVAVLLRIGNVPEVASLFALRSSDTPPMSPESTLGDGSEEPSAQHAPRCVREYRYCYTFVSIMCACVYMFVCSRVCVFALSLLCLLGLSHRAADVDAGGAHQSDYERQPTVR